MTDVVAKSVISLELDDSDFRADLPKAGRIFADFAARMQAAANIRLRHETDKNGKVVIKIDVDPRTTTAGMEVIDKIVKQHVARLNSEANIVVGVSQDQPKLSRFIDSLRTWAVNGIGIAIGQAFTFTISRNIERALLGIAKLPFRIASSAVTAAQAQQQEETKLAKAIEATGAAAKKTTSELAKKAKELEKLTGTADNTILAIQGILVAANGLDGTNFDRATVAALDLAEVLGGDAVNKAEKLAKALQEPEKALEMLRDEGVAFSKDQQDVIKYFVKINDLASAQSFILDAIEDKYGGAATSVGLFAEKMEEASNRIDTMLESMGGALLENTQEFIDVMGAGVNLLERLAPAATASAVVLAELSSAILELTIGAEDNIGTMDDFIRKVDEWRIAFKLLGDNALITRSKLAKFFVDANEWALGGVDITKLLEVDKGIEVLEKQAQDRANVLAEQLQNDRDAAKKARDDESKARREAADQRREDAKRRLEEALLLARASMEQEQAEKDKKKRLKLAEAAEDKRLKAEERARLKAQQDYEKSMGRDSLVGLHQRIQDAMYLRRQDADKQKQQNVSAKGGAAGAAGGAIAGAISAGMGGLGAAMSAVFSALIPPGAKGKKAKPAQTQEEIDADFEKERVKQEKARKNRERREAFDEKAAKELEDLKPFYEDIKVFEGLAKESAKNGDALGEAKWKYEAARTRTNLAIARGAEEGSQEVSNLDKIAEEARKKRLAIEEEQTTAAIAAMPSLSRQEATKKEAASRKAFDDKLAADEAAGKIAIQDAEARKKAEEDRRAAEQKQFDTIKDRMSPEEEKAFWDKNKPAMDALEKTLNDRNKELQKQQADKKAFDESGGPAKAAQEYEKQRKENEERRRRFSEGRTPEQQDNLRRMLESLPPLTSARPPSRRKPVFAPEGNTPSFAPEGGDIKVTVKPEQKEVVSSITAQTRALSKAITESRKLT